jgi:hypothetical protein
MAGAPMEGSSRRIVEDYWNRNQLTGDHDQDKVIKNAYLVLFNLLNHSNLETQRKALKKALKYSVYKDYVTVLVSNGLVEILIRDIRSNDEFYQEHATAILGNLACIGNHTELILRSISFPIFLQLFISGTETTQENVAGLLGNLSSTDEYREMIYRNNAIPILLQILNDSDSMNVQEATLWALSNLSSLPIVVTTLYDCDCFLSIVNSITSNNPTDELISYACTILFNISSYPTLRDNLSKENILQPVFDLFLTLSDRLMGLSLETIPLSTYLLTSCCHVSGIVSNIAWSYSIRLIVNREENIHVMEGLTQMLRLNRFLALGSSPFSPFPELTTILILSGMGNAARALSILALSDFNRESIRHTGALKVIIQLLSLSEMNHSSQNMNEIMIKKCDSIVEAGVSLICNLSKSYAFMDTILEFGGLDALLQILAVPQSPNITPVSGDEFHHITRKDYYVMTGAREGVIEALSHLTYTEEIRVLVWRSGVVPLFVELISIHLQLPSHSSLLTPQLNLPESSHPYPSSVQHSIITIANLSFCKSLSVSLHSLEILDVMIAILLKPNLPEKWKEYAALFVANLSHLDRAKAKIFHPTVIQALHSLLHQSKEVNTIVAVNMALESIPSDVRLIEIEPSSSSIHPFIATYAEWRLWILDAFRSYL